MPCTSPIATIDRVHGTIELGEDWDCSVTTGRYRNLFFELVDLSELASRSGIQVVLNAGGCATDDHCNEFIVTLA